MYKITIQDPDMLRGGEPFSVVSHGSKIFGRIVCPAMEHEEDRSPVVVLLHGHPGGDRMMDMSLFLRENGYTAVTFSYRGVWGGKGYYRLSHNIEDTIAVVGWIRENAERLHLDAERIYLFGHSMGGFAAINAVASGLAVKGVLLMAPCDIGYTYLYDQESFLDLMSAKEIGYFTLPPDEYDDYMEKDVAANAESWYFPNLISRLPAEIPYRFICGLDDAVTPPDRHVDPLYQKMTEKGFNVKRSGWHDSHMFPCTRVRAVCTALEYLAEMEQM